MNKKDVVVRFAPSPTGCLHIGALRTALFDFLYARKNNGKFILRIEDTDQSRFNPDAVTEFIEVLDWCGITVDEGPYFQSERKNAGIYMPFIRQLLSEGKAYVAFDTAEELEIIRNTQGGYFDSYWRRNYDYYDNQVPNKIGVVRLKTPRNETITFYDEIRGSITVDTNTLDDIVLLKSDGMPTYHFAAMVDDYLMGITHVIRGEEWLPSAPKHVLLLNALGFPQPKWVHCPVILGVDGKKLSKRHGATSVLDYKAMGILPSALNNFVVLIGWSPGHDLEFMTMDDLISHFDISGLQPSSGRFDFDKLLSVNQSHIQKLTPEECLKQLRQYLGYEENRRLFSNCEGDDAVVDRMDYLYSVISVLQKRTKTLQDFVPLLKAILLGEFEYEFTPEKYTILKEINVGLLRSDNWRVVFEEIAVSHNLKLKDVAAVFRSAMMGAASGIGIDELIYPIFNHYEIQKRINKVLAA